MTLKTHSERTHLRTLYYQQESGLKVDSWALPDLLPSTLLRKKKNLKQAFDTEPSVGDRGLAEGVSQSSERQ